MNPAGVLAALEHIRPPRDVYKLQRCFTRLRLLAHFGKMDLQGTPIEKGFELISEQIGMNVKTTRAVLEELVEDRVLQCERAAGSRAHIYRIEPDVRRWRGFEWTIPVSLVEQDVGFATGEYRAVNPRLSTRLYRGRQKKFVDRPIEGSTKKQLSTPLYGGGQPRALSADLPGRGEDKSLGSSSNYEVVDEKNSLSREEASELIQITGLLNKRLGGTTYGRPKKALAALVLEGLTAEAAAVLIARMPADCQHKSGVQWMTEQWHARDLVLPAVPSSEQDELEEKRQERERDQLRNLKERREVLISIGDYDGADAVDVEIGELQA